MPISLYSLFFFLKASLRPETSKLAYGDPLGCILIDLPKQHNSEVTKEARLINDPEIEFRTKLVGF